MCICTLLLAAAPHLNTIMNPNKQKIVIRAEDIIAGNMMATLRRRFGNQILLTADDEEKLVMESTTRVLAFNNLKSPQQIVEEVSNKIASLIISSREPIYENMWGSVNWSDNYRPDELANSLNRVYDKLDEDKKIEFLTSFEHTTKEYLSAEIVKLGNLDITHSTEIQSRLLEFVKLCEQCTRHVEWNGNKFTTKPLNLARIRFKCRLNNNVNPRNSGNPNSKL